MRACIHQCIIIYACMYPYITSRTCMCQYITSHTHTYVHMHILWGVCVHVFLCSVSENTTTSTPYCVFYLLLSLPQSVGWTTLTKWLRYSRVGSCCGWISSLPSCTSLQALEEHKALIDSKASFKNYRDAFGAARPPCIPYM